jgi:pimeloyl-ACP methyl ester carboxylesterase
MWLALAAPFTAHGFRVILPDFRGHGRSAKPHDAAAYPPDVLADDGLALIEHLGLDDYDLGGYSLGARIVVRMLVRGATPRRAVVAGQGLREVLGTGGGAGARLRHLIAAGRWRPAGGEPADVLLRVLDSIVVTPVADVARIQVPALVVMGADDERSASADELVAVLPNAVRAVVPGTHATAASSPELAAAMLDFLRVPGHGREPADPPPGRHADVPVDDREDAQGDQQGTGQDERPGRVGREPPDEPAP